MLRVGSRRDKIHLKLSSESSGRRLEGDAGRRSDGGLQACGERALRLDLNGPAGGDRQGECDAAWQIFGEGREEAGGTGRGIRLNRNHVGGDGEGCRGAEVRGDSEKLQRRVEDRKECRAVEGRRVPLIERLKKVGWGAEKFSEIRELKLLRDEGRMNRVRSGV